MFASGVWYSVLLCVSQAVGALAISLATMLGHFRARKKSILSTQTFLSLFGGPSAAGAAPGSPCGVRRCCARCTMRLRHAKTATEPAHRMSRQVAVYKNRRRMEVGVSIGKRTSQESERASAVMAAHRRRAHMLRAAVSALRSHGRDAHASRDLASGSVG